MARVLTLKKPNPINLVVQKFGGGLKGANVIEMRDIFEIAVVYNSIYTLDNIENIVMDSHEWVNVTINGKSFGLQYYSTSGSGGYQFRVNDTQVRFCSKKQVAEFLVGGFDEKMERFGSYRDLYKAIRDKAPNAFELYKEAVEGMDWSYMMSDDDRWYRSGIWQEDALLELAKMLGPEAEAHYMQEHDAYWKRVNST
jgi:hypothetical protein